FGARLESEQPYVIMTRLPHRAQWSSLNQDDLSVASQSPSCGLIARRQRHLVGRWTVPYKQAYLWIATPSTQTLVTKSWTEGTPTFLSIRQAILGVGLHGCAASLLQGAPPPEPGLLCCMRCASAETDQPSAIDIF